MADTNVPKDSDFWFGGRRSVAAVCRAALTEPRPPAINFPHRASESPNHRGRWYEMHFAGDLSEWARGFGPRRTAIAALRSLLFFFIASLAAAAEAPLTKLYLIGGSTMASYPTTRPVVGWGQMLPRFFKDPAQIDNRALSGRSTKSFIDQGHWDKVIADIRAGDFLIMCWGTNDSSSDPARKTDPRTTFRANLLRFITEIRAKGATPILATQVAHRRWDANGQWNETASDYVIVNRELAVSERVPLLEMFDRTTALEQSLGVAGSIALHLYLPAGKHASYPNGSKDDTHYNEYGATRIAELAVAEIRRLKLPLVAWLREPMPASTPPGPR